MGCKLGIARSRHCRVRLRLVGEVLVENGHELRNAQVGMEEFWIALDVSVDGLEKSELHLEICIRPDVEVEVHVAEELLEKRSVGLASVRSAKFGDCKRELVENFDGLRGPLVA